MCFLSSRNSSCFLVWSAWRHRVHLRVTGSIGAKAPHAKSGRPGHMLRDLSGYSVSYSSCLPLRRGSRSADSSRSFRALFRSFVVVPVLRREFLVSLVYNYRECSWFSCLLRKIT